MSATAIFSAINGKLNSADVYPSNGLFRKMWIKGLHASTTEAIGNRIASADIPPHTEAALAFLTDAMSGAAIEKPLTERLSLETRDTDRAFYFETKRVVGGWVHRNYLAK